MTKNDKVLYHGICDDCEESSDELSPWRYEPEVLLCPNCYENRDKDEDDE